ncbi:MAG: tRNA lysidine(34) synthetase TilS [Flavobacteriales bacterium]|nr:tRNA lysidine(34) synthetase TilS [Flavobacteriales bacterium]
MKNRILIAISGGLDSMVLLHRLLSEHQIEDLAVAHCNFKLRGKESDEDERFVVKACELYGVKYYLRSFRTEEIADQRKLSIQETARNLRYKWFFELQQEEQFHHIATAHHFDDSVETFFINLLRGTGPSGLSGIREDSSRGLIRPLLGMTKVEIRTYAEKHELDWREDSSNRSKKYLRNRIRYELFPLMEDIRPGFRKAMKQNMLVQSQMSDLIDELYEGYLTEHVKENNGVLRIALLGTAQEKPILHKYLSGYSFSHTQIENILDSQHSGKQAFSSSHTITRQGSELLLNPLKDEISGVWNIDEDLDLSHLPINIQMTVLDSRPQDFKENRAELFLDYQLLKFPLTVRKWKEGDSFIPLGMSGHKKVSDYLIDSKVPLEEKKRVFVLESNGEILCLIGQRINDRFKITKSTEEVLVLKFKD